MEQIKHRSNYTQQSLPHLLTEYGFDDGAGRRRKQGDTKCEQVTETMKIKPRDAKKKMRILNYIIDVQDEKALKRQKEKDEYSLQMIQDMHRLRDHYYKEYTDRLAQKVQRQRKEIREKDIQSKEKREKKEEEERQANHKIKKRLERHTLTTYSARVNAHKTDIYHIVGLEEKLRREGKLKTVSDYNTFWLKTQDPHVFFANFKVNKHLGAGKPSEVSQPQQELRALSRISEFRDSARPETCTESWNVTQQFPAKHDKEYKSTSSLQTSRLKQDNQTDLDKRFPKLEMPKLHCFTMRLDTDLPDTDQIQQKIELRAREKHRKMMMRKVAKMYQLAMSNVATSSRLLDQHEDMEMLFYGSDVCDMVNDPQGTETHRVRGPEVTDLADNQKTEEEALMLAKEKDGQNDALRSQTMTEDIYFVPGGSDALVSQAVREDSSVSGTSDEEEDDSRKRSANSKNNLVSEKSRLPLPLTMEEVKGRCNTVEAKSLSTFWTNYMGAGK